jgi:hypothetical protein
MLRVTGRGHLHCLFSALHGQRSRGFVTTPGKLGINQRACHGSQRHALAEQRPLACDPRARLAQHLLSQRSVFGEVRETQRVHPRNRRDVADKRSLRIRRGENSGDRERIA